MKIFLAVLACCFALGAIANDEIIIIRHGTNVTQTPSARFSTYVIDLLQTCSVHSTAYAVKPDTWKDLEQSDSFVVLKFQTPRELKVMLTPGTGTRQREKKSIDQILVPLPEAVLPGHIYAKSGTNILSFTKYSPVALKQVAFEPAVQLSSVKPYAALAKILEHDK